MSASWVEEQAEFILAKWPKDSQPLMRQGVKDLIVTGMRAALEQSIREADEIVRSPSDRGDLMRTLRALMEPRS